MDNPGLRLGDLSLLSPRERQRILVDWNQTEHPFPSSACLHRLIEEQVERTPDAVAVTFAGRSLTYREINRQANQVAHRLICLGVGVEDRVAVSLRRSVEMITGLLGVLKAGAAYVPVDPDYPSERLAYLMADCRPAALLTTSDVEERLPAQEAKILRLDTDASLREEPETDPRTDVTAENLVYVIYTSGSTGRPKGAGNLHRAVVNRLDWMRRHYDVDSADCILHKTPFSFDVSVWELFLPLLTGARLVLAGPGDHREMTRLVEIIRREEVTMMHFVPSLLEIFVETEGVEACDSLRAVVASGEALPHALQQRFFARLKAELHNLYGPTEAAVDVTYWHCPRESASRIVPIGRPISNVRIYVLDPALQPVPVGVSGELHIGGVALARGYLERPDLTAARFIPDPHGGEPGARLYKTGDLARFLPDGNVEFQGRIDHQVKLRGYRIELGEIETVLTEHRQVRQAVVDLRADTQGHKRLVAWVVLAAGAEADPIGELRRHAAGKLPEYMVPSAFAVLESLPLNPSGKVDRKALPEPDLGSRTRDSYVPPSGPVEEDLVRIWGELLPVERIGVRDNFFEIGGDSIISIQVVARARKKGIVLEVNEIFRTPTIAGLAELAASRAAVPLEETAVPARPMALAGLSEERIEILLRDLPGAEDVYPLSPMQAGLLFRSLYLPSSDSYLNQNVVEIRGPVDEDLLRRAWTEVVNHYTILRSGFLYDGLSEPLQYVMDRVDLPWTAHDWRSLSAGEREAEFARLMAEDRKRPFELTQAPLLRVQWMRLADDHGYLLWAHHHILLDGWCLSLIWGNMFAAYEQLKATGRVSLPLSRPYRDYIEWLLRQETRSESESFWRRYLAGFSRVTGFSEVETHFDGEYDTFVLALPEDRTEELRRLAQRYRVTLNTFVQAVWSLLLARYSRRRDVVFGVSVSGRPVELSGVEDMVGLFINTLPLRVRIDPGAGLRTFLEDLQANMVGINDHAQVPLAKIKSWCEASGNAGKPLFETLIAFENYPEDKLPSGHVADLEVRDLLAMEKTEYPLGMIVLPEERLIFHLNYDTSHFDRGFVVRLGEQILTLLEAMLADPEGRIGSFPLLREEEARCFAQEWTGPAGTPPEPVCRTFERRAALAPHRPAVVDAAGAVTTYGELDRRAAEIARRIGGLGGPGEWIVALLADRSVDMVAGLLGIWKAGAACLPLDPAHPEARLRHLLEDSGAAALLAPAGLMDLAERLPAPAVPLGSGPVPGGSEASAGRDADPGRLAYVMYTSGSTGQPKGVLCTHGGLANRVRWSLASLGATGEDALLHIATPGFDIALWEILFPLLSGGRLVLPEEERRADPAYLAERVEAEGVTVLHFVPSLLRAFVDLAPTERCRGLRQVACGGEALPEALRHRFEERFGARLHHWYGPTEAAISVTSWECEERADRIVPIGRPIDGARVYVLDDGLRPVPPSVAGEIFLGGVPLARGYLGNAALTAAFWVPDPVSGEPGARLYRTGDLGRILPDGQLSFVGRIDEQIKIRGQRIEPGEVEAALLSHDGVAAAVAGIHEPRPGERQLAAWVQPREGRWRGADERERAAELQEHLRRRLPEALVPPFLLFLDELPLLPSGKVDRASLPRPSAAAARPGRVAPRNPVEAELARIWRELLEVEEVGVTDSFFELGGHSLLVISLLHRIDQTFGRGSLVNITDIFKRATIEDLARVLEGMVDPRPDTLVPLQAEGFRMPLVLVHPGEGLALSYRSLLDHLPGRPLYAINNPHFGDPERAFRSVEEMARCYLGYLRNRFPEGPYCLGGWSFGGVVALEMAVQLAAGGQEVEAVVLIDSYNFAGFDLPEPEDGAAELLARRGIPVDTEEGRKLRFEINHNGRLALRYRPCLYEGRVILLLAEDRDPDDELARDPYNGWRGTLAREPEVYRVRGAHQELFDPRRVGLVGSRITEALEGGA